MKNIGIIGSGIAGLHLGLFLQKHGIDATIYSDKSPAQIRAGRIPNFVVRFDDTLERERALGVDHWNFPDFGVHGVHMYIAGDPSPIVWFCAKKQPASAVDMRIYQSTLLEDFAERGGKVVAREVQAGEVEVLAEQHDLMVVASGRGSLTEIFPRDAARSPFAEPQRFLTGAFFRGVNFTEPNGVIYTISPGNGEIFQAPFTTFDGQRVCSLLFEAIPGQAFDALSHLRYADAPQKFETTVIDLIREYAPMIYERIDLEEFGVLRPLDVLQGAITPTVRYGYTALGNGKFALALGDAHMQVDPVIAQGANSASKCAWILGEALLEDLPLNEAFCRQTEQKLFQAAQAAIEWTNATLQPPPAHAIEVFAAAARNQAIADELVENFNAPERNWKIFSDPANAADFLKRHTLQMTAA
jgi:2-polyprenyl-6-methoxyphenol hydroxylase-like FAD-dependent oxidoreductase